MQPHSLVLEAMQALTGHPFEDWVTIPLPFLFDY